MDNEYNLGNYIISNNFDEITYELNTNYYNNILYFYSNISPYSNLKYLNFNVVFTYNSIFNYKIDLYKSFQLINNKYYVYDVIDNYDVISYVSNNIYDSNKYHLTKDTNNYYLLDKKNDISYTYRINENYPYLINVSNRETIYLTINNNKITKIECNNEMIIINYYTSKMEITSYNKINSASFPSTKMEIEKINDNNIKIKNYTYEYDSDDENYIPYEIKELDLRYQSNQLIITNQINNNYVKFYYNNNKIIKIEEYDGNTYETNITYNLDSTIITYDDTSTKIIYDYNKMKKGIIIDDKYVKYYEYDNYLIKYESEYLKNETIINSNLLSFNEITYEPVDDDDMQDYSFSVTQILNPEIESELTGFINSNDVYKIEGYGKLYKIINQYGEESDSCNMLLFYKLGPNSSFSAEIKYYASNYPHTSKIKTVTILENRFMPLIIGQKPDYSYDRIEISLFVNGTLYVNTPKLILNNMGVHYYYDNTQKLISIKNNNGIEEYTYDNNKRIIKTENELSEINYTRDNYGNIIEENNNGNIINRTYDNYNRVITETHDSITTTYTYNENLTDNIYKRNVTAIKNNITNEIEYDNVGRINHIELSQTGSNPLYKYRSYAYDGIKKINITEPPVWLVYQYDNEERLISSNLNYGIGYNYSYINPNINEIKYDNTYRITKNTYDTKNRLTQKVFNGTYNISYLDNQNKINIYYNNNLKYEINYNEYDLITNNGYNSNIIYDQLDNIKQYNIDSYTFKFYKNDTLTITQNNNNYYYNGINYGYPKLKDDNYYSNITYHDNDDISIINSSIYVSTNYSTFYPLTSNLLSLNGNSPISFLKQDYKLFYYDKDIDNYCLLLYGTMIKYETNIINQGIIQFDIKLENRTINQLIIELESNYNDLKIYRNTSKKLVIEYNGNNISIGNVNIESNKWYNFQVLFNNGNISVKYKLMTQDTYNTKNFTHNNNTNETPNILIIGKTEYYYDPKKTFGLIRNIFISMYPNESILDVIYKTNSYLENNELKKEEIRYNNQKISEISRTKSIDNLNITNIDRIVTNNLYLLTKFNNNICLENGRIINLYDDYKWQYDYDTLGRITKETNSKWVGGSSNSYYYEINYTYDNINNITSWEYKLNHTIKKKLEYTYDTTNKQILKSVKIDNQIYPITYNNTGLQPISFMNNTYEYEGNRLIKYNDYNYEYNVKGLRIRKYSDNLETNIYYYYDKDDKLIIENHLGSYDIRYLYDSNNEIYGFIRLNNTYFYIKDELGIIIGIMDINKNILGYYNYSAFGLEINPENNNMNNILEINPIRYKSYYYDIESNMYYLRSRYYNPLLARFITPDSYQYIDIENYETYNLYVYCNNDPVNYSDRDGSFPILALILAGTFALGFGSSLFMNAATNNWQLDWRDFLQAGVDGAFAVGATLLSMTGIGVVGSIAASAAMGWSQYAIGAGIQGDNITLAGSLTAIVIGALGSGAGAANSANIGKHMIGLSDDGVRAIGAITNAANRKAAGIISAKGLQATLNLYGRTAFNAVQAAIPGTMRSLFLSSARKIAFYTVLANVLQSGLNYGYKVWGAI